MQSAKVIGFGDEESFKTDGIFNKKKKKGGGGFQSMGLSPAILKGIQKRGYRIPTPIQRKTIPVALQGSDLVAMARTGSGKTACFLIPIFEKLKMRTCKTGARALVMSPTRELALQTLAFIREIGKFIDLKAALILGGDSMDSQFEALHGNPDIIVATPGRFMHVCVEMDFKLNSIEIVVFDEADRLFEMGFGEQLKEIIARLPSSRQTLLFSATLPKVLVEFTRAGLTNPVLIRLDVDSKLPEELELAFIWTRPEEKTAGLLCLLNEIMKNENYQQVIIFAATKHHVEFLSMLLDIVGIPNTYLFSNLDPSARKLNVSKFRDGKVKVMVVTDVAARGIDIPDVGVVINYQFPAAPKLFVHRVGRCARAGRCGTAYSLICREELPYLLDLHLFLGRPIKICGKDKYSEEGGFVGCIPDYLLEQQHHDVMTWHHDKADIEAMAKVCKNGYSKYLKSRPGASGDSVKRSKLLDFNNIGSHPIFGNTPSADMANDMIRKMKSFKPHETVFELTTKGNSEELKAIRNIRSFHEKSIDNYHKKQKERAESNTHDGSVKSKLAQCNPEDIQNIFSSVVMPRKRKFDPDYHNKSKKLKRDTVDKDNFIPYAAPDHHTEIGLAVNTFENEAKGVSMDLIGDDEKSVQRQKNVKKWDQKRKKYVGAREQVKKIRTESGVWINATYKTGKYAEWKEKSKADANNDDSDDDNNDDNEQQQQQLSFGRGGNRRGRGGSMQRGGRGGGIQRGGRGGGIQRGGRGGGMQRGGMKGGNRRMGGRSELKRPEQILKAREKKERDQQRLKQGKKKKRGGGGGGRKRR